MLVLWFDKGGAQTAVKFRLLDPLRCIFTDQVSRIHDLMLYIGNEHEFQRVCYPRRVAHFNLITALRSTLST